MFFQTPRISTWRHCTFRQSRIKPASLSKITGLQRLVIKHCLLVTLVCFTLKDKTVPMYRTSTTTSPPPFKDPQVFLASLTATATISRWSLATVRTWNNGRVKLIARQKVTFKRTLITWFRPPLSWPHTSTYRPSPTTLLLITKRTPIPQDFITAQSSISTTTSCSQIRL